MENRPDILLVEDSPTQSQEIAAQMSQYDINVIVANDGPQGLRIAKELQPGVIVLDINLPSMSGFQVCKRLKRDPATVDIPVIMLTSADRPEDMLSGLDAGASDYITKDQFAAESLMTSLRSLGVVR
jgi:DNA-binding response OmpR family regulator